MTKKGKKNNQSKNKTKLNVGLLDETKRSIWVVFSFVVFAVLALSSFGKAGILGGYIKNLLVFLFGRGFFVSSITALLLGVFLLKDIKKKTPLGTIFGVGLFFLSSLGILDIVFGNYGGGYVGFAVSYPFLYLFDYWVSVIVFLALFLISFLMVLNSSFDFERKTKPTQSESIEAGRDDDEVVEWSDDDQDEDEEKQEENIVPKQKKETEAEVLSIQPKKQYSLKYVPPPADLLEDDKGTPSSGDVKANANIIKRTLQNFGIDVEMFEVNVGPSVTQYTLKPAEGIKLSRITALQSDLSLALAAHHLRIEAPIPGKSLVGIEVPNRSIALVGLRSLLSSEEFQKSDRPLLFALGRDVSGKGGYADLAKMPHLLIAGATGT